MDIELITQEEATLNLRWQVDGNSCLSGVHFYHISVFNGTDPVSSCKLRFSCLAKIHQICQLERFAKFPSKHLTHVKSSLDDHVFAAQRESELDIYFLTISRHPALTTQDKKSLIAYWKKLALLPSMKDQMPPVWSEVN